MVGYSRAWVRLVCVLSAAIVVGGGCAITGSAPDEKSSSAVPTPPTSVTTGVVASSESVASSTVASSRASSVSATTGADASVAPTTAVASKVAPVSKEWTLLAGGDVLMDRTEPGGVDPFEYIEPALASADVAVVNSEMAISDRGVPADKQYVFRAPPSAARRIASAGVDVVSLSNNHAKDYGGSALVDTVELLEGAGVVALGAGATDVDAYRYRVLDVAGDVSVAFVGVSMIVPWGFSAGPGSPGIASARPPSRVTETVGDAAGVADVVIALVHWGVERTTCPVGTSGFSPRSCWTPAPTRSSAIIPMCCSRSSSSTVDWLPTRWATSYGIRDGVSPEKTGVLQIDFDADEIVGWMFHPHLLNEDGAPAPVAEGGRHDRIVDIIAGNCARHQPPPPSTTTTTEATTATTKRPQRRPSPRRRPPEALQPPPRPRRRLRRRRPPPATRPSGLEGARVGGARSLCNHPHVRLRPGKPRSSRSPAKKPQTVFPRWVPTCAPSYGICREPRQVRFRTLRIEDSGTPEVPVYHRGFFDEVGSLTSMWRWPLLRTSRHPTPRIVGLSGSAPVYSSRACSDMP